MNENEKTKICNSISGQNIKKKWETNWGVAGEFHSREGYDRRTAIKSMIKEDENVCRLHGLGKGGMTNLIEVRCILSVENIWCE